MPSQSPRVVERELILETRVFMQVVAGLLAALHDASRDLRRRLQRTERYRRSARAGAEHDLVFDQAGTLSDMLEFDLQHAVGYLRTCARRAAGGRSASSAARKTVAVKGVRVARRRRAADPSRAPRTRSGR